MTRDTLIILKCAISVILLIVLVLILAFRKASKPRSNRTDRVNRATSDDLNGVRVVSTPEGTTVTDLKTGEVRYQTDAASVEIRTPDGSRIVNQIRRRKDGDQ